MNDLNEKLKGWRTTVVVILGMILSTMDTLRELVASIGEIVGAQMADGGSAGLIVGGIVALKALITDVIPKLKGNLDRTKDD